MMDVIRERFPLLVALVVASAPLGLTAGAVGRIGGPAAGRFSLARALCAGGVAGLAGGWAFGKWMEQAGFFPLVAGLIRSDSRWWAQHCISSSPGLSAQRSACCFSARFAAWARVLPGVPPTASSGGSSEPSRCCRS